MTRFSVKKICRLYGVELIRVEKWTEIYGWPNGCAAAIPKARRIEYEAKKVTRSCWADDVIHELCHLLRGDELVSDYDDDFERLEGGLMVLQYGLIQACLHESAMISRFMDYGWEGDEWQPQDVSTRRWQELRSYWAKTGALDENGLPTWRWPDFDKLTTEERENVVNS